MDLAFTSIDDSETMRRMLARRAETPSELSEHSFSYLSHWSGRDYRVGFAETAGCGVLRFSFANHVYFSLPFGAGDGSAVLAALPRQRAFGPLTRGEADALATRGAFVFPYWGGPDYVYEQRDLATLAGSRYQSKRNFCHRFEACGPWHYGPFGAADAERVLSVWEREHALDEEARTEWAAIRSQLPSCATGGVLYQSDRPVAFAMGERLTDDMLLVSYEKALPDVVGAYAMINREFARREGAGYRWLNRASADGHPNLVKAKESYHPSRRLEKFMAFEPGLPDGLRVRPAESGDEARIVALWQEAFGAGDTAEFIRGILARATSFVIADGDRVVSMAHVLPHEGVRYVYACATRSDARGRGCMSALLQAVRLVFSGETLALVPGEPSLVPFYERLGFAVASREGHVTMSDPPQPGFRISDPMK